MLRFSPRLDVLRNSTAISLRFKNEAFNISKCYYIQLLFCFRTTCLGIYFATSERIIDHFWMLVGSLRRVSPRLDVLRNSTAISLRFKNEVFNISKCYYIQLLFCFRTTCCLGIYFATSERIIDHFWMLVGSLRRVSLRLDVLWRCTAISLRCKNEAFWSASAVSHYFCF